MYTLLLFVLEVLQRCRLDVTNLRLDEVSRSIIFALRVITGHRAVIQELAHMLGEAHRWYCDGAMSISLDLDNLRPFKCNVGGSRGYQCYNSKLG